jgi:hypothetical protein
MFEDLSVAQIQSCLTDDIDITLFKRFALETQKLMSNYDNNGNDAYSISEGSTAALYCKEIINTFSSQEHTEAWELEFNSHYESVQAAGFKINDLLKAE